MIRWKQATDGFADFGMTFGNPDFVAFARAHHAGGTRVETAEGLVPAAGAGFSTGRRATGRGPHRLQREHAGPRR
jgi:acetolactate synthase-1/2/3 large subunit